MFQFKRWLLYTSTITKPMRKVKKMVIDDKDFSGRRSGVKMHYDYLRNKGASTEILFALVDAYEWWLKEEMSDIEDLKSFHNSNFFKNINKHDQADL